VARKKLVGTITSDKMDKTWSSAWNGWSRTRSTKIREAAGKTSKAHDEKNEFRVGDRVEIVETRPMSKDKRGASPG